MHEPTDNNIEIFESKWCSGLLTDIRKWQMSLPAHILEIYIVEFRVHNEAFYKATVIWEPGIAEGILAA